VKEYELDRIALSTIATQEKYDLIYVFKQQNILSPEIVSSAKLELVDIHITMSKTLYERVYLHVDNDFRTILTEKEKQECYKIAEETAVVSRFYKEPLIGEVKTKELYRKWIDNALNKTFSDGLFVHKEGGSIDGIHLIKTDNENRIGYFTLTGVSSSSKRKGIGRNLWMQSFSYWSNKHTPKIEIVKSPFSIQNNDSFQFHLNMGFDKVEEIKYIYCFRNQL
jgi:hypothetical protein